MDVRMILVLAVISIIYTKSLCVLDTDLETEHGRKHSKTFQYTIVNQYQEPFFDETMEFTIKYEKPFIEYMQDAVMANPNNFTSFTATFSSPYGYVIEAINGVAGNWQQNLTFWEINDENGSIPGVSEYLPQSKDHIILNLTTLDVSRG